MKHSSQWWLGEAKKTRTIPQTHILLKHYKNTIQSTITKTPLQQRHENKTAPQKPPHLHKNSTTQKEPPKYFYGVGFMQCGNLDWLSGCRWIWQRDSLNCVIHQHEGEPTYLSLLTGGKYARKLRAAMGNCRYESDLWNIPTSSWRGFK